MARLEGTDRRYFEIVPHPTVRGENVLGEFVFSFSAGGRYVFHRYCTFEEVYDALDLYRQAIAQR